MASIIKAALALRNRQIPPSLNFRRPNPRIAFEQTPFWVNAELRPWAGEGTRRCGVSSFGVGGTNAHLVIEEAPALSVSEKAAPAEHVLALSARSEGALGALKDAI